MDGTQGSMETLRQVRHAVLIFGIEKQRGQDVSLQPRPEDRQQRRRRTSHSLNLQADYPKCQVARRYSGVLRIGAEAPASRAWAGPQQVGEPCGPPLRLRTETMR